MATDMKIVPIVLAIMAIVIPVKAGDGKLSQNGVVLSVEVLNIVFIVREITKTMRSVLRVMVLVIANVVKKIKANAIHVRASQIVKPVEATVIALPAKTTTANVLTVAATAMFG